MTTADRPQRPSTTAEPSAASAAGWDESPPRYAVGIDLGTTNCAMAFVDTAAPPWSVQDATIPQWVDFGVRESRLTLPSFHYQPTSEEASATRLDMPWDKDGSPERCVGVLARQAGARHPGRRIQSAKSWLSHDGVDRSAKFLPWHGETDVDKLSPVDAAAAYLEHLRRSWDHRHPDHPLADQDVVVTLPASFDEVARELTVAAAKQAGLRRIHLLEEPQAAFYGWIDREGDAWEAAVRRGDLVLVCDIGGGTTDLTLIRVKPVDRQATGPDSEGSVQFHRVAVGKHLILGGDNLDLAIAKFVEQKLQSELAPAQWDRLITAAREAKETMLADDRPPTYTINLPSGGSKLVGGAVQVTLTADEIDDVLIDGFFPDVAADAMPASGVSGFQEFGLPYAADPAITRHLAAFLSQHRQSGIDADDTQAETRPTQVLFNGGVMSAGRLQARVVDSLDRWFGKAPNVLTPARLDLAVARGAAYYAMVRRGEGVRIAANLGRSYYLQVGREPATGLVLIPGNAQTGQVFAADTHPLQMQVGAPVQFPMWVSSTRLADSPDTVLPIDRQEMSPLPPVRTALMARKKRVSETVGVRLEAELSEIGTVEIHCVETESSKRWKLDFDIRSTLETDRDAHVGGGEAAGIVDPQTVADAVERVASVFDSNHHEKLKPGKLLKRLQESIGENRKNWPPSLLRQLWASLLDLESGRRQSESHEARWLNLTGYCLRPGYGMAVDDWRVAETWRRVHGKLSFPAAATRLETLILWRRVAGGLIATQQQQLAATWSGALAGKISGLSQHEIGEAWRMIASLEQLPAQDKIRWGELALQNLRKTKSAKLHATLVWCSGRLATRRPVHGPLTSVVSADRAGSWARDLISIATTLDGEARGMIPLALAQMTRRTNDRYLDVSQAERDEVLNFMKQSDAPEHLQSLVSQGGRLAGDEQDAVFGESLPLGIRLA